MDNKQIEQAVQDKGLVAPRITLAQIKDVIIAEQFYVPPGTTLTLCVLTLRNGFTVVGESACVSPANFNKELGESIARSKAEDKIWALEGYALRDRLFSKGAL